LSAPDGTLGTLGTLGNLGIFNLHSVAKKSVKICENSWTNFLGSLRLCGLKNQRKSAPSAIKKCKTKPILAMNCRR
jgi:hypothetical protein